MKDGKRDRQTTAGQTDAEVVPRGSGVIWKLGILVNLIEFSVMFVENRMSDQKAVYKHLPDQTEHSGIGEVSLS